MLTELDSTDTLRLLGTPVPASFDPDTCVVLPPTAVAWALSHKARNRLQHALNGNPSLTQRPGLLDRQQLQKLQEAGKLRAAGWTLPAAVDNKLPVRVYDTRIPKEWLLQLAADLRRLDESDQAWVVGGDFASGADLTDADVAACPDSKRWSDEPRHLVIPPRPHLRELVLALRRRAEVEHPASLISLAVLVDRHRCPADLDVAALRPLLGEAAALFDDPRLQVEVVALAERAPVLRIPATVKCLPPEEWEPGFLPRSQVLLFLNLRRPAAGVEVANRWVRGALPDPEPSGLELLRVEFQLPPTVRQRNAERELRRALGKVAGAVGVVFGAAHRVQGLQTLHSGEVLAILVVPRAEALQWMRGSGSGGLFIRPFWTKETAPALQREQFNLLYLRGRRADAAALWDALHDVPGVVGLLPAEKDLAVRISVRGGADPAVIQGKVRAVLNDPKAALRQPTPGASWWRLGPLTDADVFRVRELIAMVGLDPLRGEVRLGAAGPFR
eukprot:EG_transcript_9974